MLKFNDPNFECAIYSVSTFRTLGTASSPQNIFTIENPSGSVKIVVVRYIDLWVDQTAALATVTPTIILSGLASLPTNGTTLTATKSDSGSASATAVCRGGTASHGGTATAITATAGTAIYSGLLPRLHTAAGIVNTGPLLLLSDNNLLREFVVLKAGESLLVQAVTAAAATDHFLVNCDWQELDKTSLT